MIKSIMFVLLLSISFANSSTVELTHKNFDKTIKENNKTVVMFSAPWCGVCKSMKPIYQELSKDLDGVTFATIDTDKEQNISARYGIKSLPTTIVFENSKEINREVGALNKIELTALIELQDEKTVEAQIIDEEENRDATIVIFIILFYLFMIIMHFKQKRVILENKESKITEEVPLLFSWSMVIFGWFVPLFRKHGSGMVAFILLIVQIVTGGFGTIFWAFFCNRNYIQKLLYLGYEPANEESKILLASKGLIDSSEIDPDKLPKKRNIVIASLIWIVKAVVLVSVLFILSVIITEIFMK